MNKNTKTTRKISTAKIYQIMSDLEHKLDSLGATDEAKSVRSEKEKIMKNLGDEYLSDSSPLLEPDSFSDSVIARSVEIDWNNM